MKKIISAALAAVMLTALVGCSDGGASSSVPQSSVTDAVSAPAGSLPDDSADSSAESVPLDYSQLTDEEIYDLMVKRSLLSTGDMTRMANVLGRARDGGDITVAYIGGSITEGYNAGTDDFYAKICTDRLQEMFPQSKVTGVNAGISGTPSILGNLRLERDVLAYDPDIVFVEFAVNDGADQPYKDAYESLVRTLLTQDKDIAVVLLFTIIKSGHTCQPHMSKIGENYGLPMISLPDSVWVEMKEGRMKWEDYSDDESHPNAFGHSCIRDFVSYYYEQVIPVIDEKSGAVDKNLPQPVFSGRYADMHFTDSLTLEGVEAVNFTESDTHSSFHNGWAYKGKDGASLRFKINCRVLEMVFKANNSAIYADADIYVDGVKAKTVSSNRSDGWSNPVTSYLIDEDSAAEHEVEIRVEAGQNLVFFVLAFGYCV